MAVRARAHSFRRLTETVGARGPTAAMARAQGPGPGPQGGGGGGGARPQQPPHSPAHSLSAEEQLLRLLQGGARLRPGLPPVRELLLLGGGGGGGKAGADGAGRDTHMQVDALGGILGQPWPAPDAAMAEADSGSAGSAAEPLVRLVPGTKRRRASLEGPGAAEAPASLSRPSSTPALEPRGSPSVVAEGYAPAPPDWAALPKEYLEAIFRKLGPRGTAVAGAVCRRWRAHAGSEFVWEHHCAERGIADEGAGKRGGATTWKQAYLYPDATEGVFRLLDAKPPTHNADDYDVFVEGVLKDVLKRTSAAPSRRLVFSRAGALEELLAMLDHAQVGVRIRAANVLEAAFDRAPPGARKPSFRAVQAPEARILLALRDMLKSSGPAEVYQAACTLAYAFATATETAAYSAKEKAIPVFLGAIERHRAHVEVTKQLSWALSNMLFNIPMNTDGDIAMLKGLNPREVFDTCMDIVLQTDAGYPEVVRLVAAATLSQLAGRSAIHLDDARYGSLARVVTFLLEVINADDDATAELKLPAVSLLDSFFFADAVRQRSELCLAAIPLGAITKMLELLRTTADEEMLQSVAEVLRNMSYACDGAREEIVAAGGLAVMARLLVASQNLQGHSAATFWHMTMSAKPAVRDAIDRVAASLIPVLANLVQCNAPEIQREAAGALGGICAISPRHAKLVCRTSRVLDGILSQLLGVLKDCGRVVDQEAVMAALLALCRHGECSDGCHKCLLAGCGTAAVIKNYLVPEHAPQTHFRALAHETIRELECHVCTHPQCNLQQFCVHHHNPACVVHPPTQASPGTPPPAPPAGNGR